MTDDLGKRIFDEIKALMPVGVPIVVPPNVIREMQGRFVGYEKDRSIAMAFPVPEKYAGPAGTLQGGLITAAFDAAFGTLGFLSTGHPVATISIETTFMRSIKTGDDELMVEVFLRGKTRNIAFFDGNAYDRERRLCATSKASFAILHPRPAKE